MNNNIIDLNLCKVEKDKCKNCFHYIVVFGE